jgi:hypothetical protein
VCWLSRQAIRIVPRLTGQLVARFTPSWYSLEVGNEIITSVIPDLLVRAQTRIFFQGHIRRCLMFIEGGNEAHLSGRDLVSITCARAIYETVACVFDFCEKLYDHLNEGNFEKTAQYLLSLMDTGIDFMQKRVDGHSFHSLKAVKSSRRR